MLFRFGHAREEMDVGETAGSIYIWTTPGWRLGVWEVHDKAPE